MHGADQLSIEQRLRQWIDHLSHVLPAQAPIRDFVHHNTLHGFQHLPFPEALAAAQRLTGATPYWPEARFLAAFADGRIVRDDLLAAFAEVGLADLDQPVIAGVARRDVLLASLLAPALGAYSAWAEREGVLPQAAIFARCRALTAAVAAQPENWEELARQRWAELCARVGDAWTLRSLLDYLSGQDVLETVRSILQRHLAAHLDLGVAAWPNPARRQGFFAAWRASAGLDLAWELDELPNVRDEIVHLAGDPLAVLVEALSALLPEEELWPGYIQRLALELPGWSGMFLWRAEHPGYGDETPVDMLDYLAVRVLLERLLCEDLICRLTGAPMGFEELRGYYAAEPAEFFLRDALRRGMLPEEMQHRVARLIDGNDGSPPSEADWRRLAEAAAAGVIDGEAAGRAWQLCGLLVHLGGTEGRLAELSPADATALLAVADSLSPLARGQIWLQAYERHYREQTFTALAANHGRQPAPSVPSAQVVMCMDDREEGTRRHLEALAPAVATYGAAGFFGVAMYWQGVDDAAPSALCPVVVRPRHLVREQAAEPAAGVAYGERRGRRLRWREHLCQDTRRRALAGPLFTAVAAPPALAALLAGSLAPGWFGEAVRRWRDWLDGRPASRLQLTDEADRPSPTPDQPGDGFTDAEQVDRVDAFLRSIGLTGDFAPLVLLLGHGSASANNPHLAAYDCGACSGRHGGPNARVFAAMANRPAVRAALADRGLRIPESCWFVAAEHNTCDDGIDWYDLDLVPGAWQPALDRLVGQLAEACRAHAAERCRRLASAPPDLAPWPGLAHVRARRHDISQSRPELGHVNNAAAFVGRRAMSRGLFLDRRVFLISYDPLADGDGQIVESILLAVGPVGAGISLEYYFSTVDNQRFGCGSKITHNITGLFGVMDGADSDLRTGLPWQMVEIHEPMRLLVVVEQTPAVLSAIVARQPVLRQLIANAWIILAAKNPASAPSTAAIHHYCPRRGWLAWSGPAVLPQVAHSVDWYAGSREALGPALLLGGAP